MEKPQKRWGIIIGSAVIVMVVAILPNQDTLYSIMLEYVVRHP